MNNIILIGMPGSGKSTVGVLLAKSLGYDFLDTDLVIQKREGKLLQNLVDSLGVDGFLDVESAAVRSIQCENTIVSPGGSVVCREEMMSHLKTLGCVIYLHVPLEELKSRIDNISTRGIAMRSDESLGDVLDFRAPLYEKYADFVVNIKSQDSPEEAIRQIVMYLTETAQATNVLI